MAATGPYYALGPAFIAANQGFFANEGISIDLQIIQPAASAAGIAGGGIDFIVSASTDVVNLAAKGIPVLAVAGFERYLVLDVVVSDNIWAKKGLSREMKLQDKFRALKGMTIGTTGPGTSTQVLLDWMLNDVGLKPRDVTAITAATPGELRALLISGQVDAFISAPPISITVEKEGNGKVFLRSSRGEIPDFGSEFIYETNFTSKAFADKNPDVVKKVNRALLRGVAFIMDEDPSTSIKALGKAYSYADPAMLAQSLKDGRLGFDRKGLMTQEQWKRSVEFFKLSGQDVSAVDTKEGVFWTNKYLQ
jgi:NitT/TauT family transport system substrate-binding protein